MIILTTHAMEEADVLSDRIGVIVDGQLKCVGTSLYLKNKFGVGYRVSIACQVEHISLIVELMSKVAPSSQLLD